MTSITATCSFGLIFRRKDSENNGVSMHQYNGLRAIETTFKPSGSISTSASKSKAIKAISAPKRETDPKKRVVITGMGVVSVFGNDVDTFYDKLLEGESGITLIDKFDASTFTVRFAGIGGMTSFSNGVEALIQKGFKKITPFFIPYSITNMGSALLAIDTGLMGPNYSISTACATANYCFYAAANHIRRGEADIMVVGGTEAAVNPTGVGGFIACRALSQRNHEPHKASRPWDQDRDGFVIGEGAGVLIMESLEHASKRGANIIAEYLGGAITCDAHHMTDPRKDGLGSMIGHGLGAAGGLEAIVCIKAITTGWLHPTINQDNLEPQVDIDTVPNVKKRHEVNVAISNSFGFGGHNSVVAFTPFNP
ncbi:Beta-ketoacyl synthase, active site-containing protein [Cynara cardunculus var. scolymus]|uniref:beta-ketoacyl-[acyl-carrier-protein] synthase I n=1 Tax=Cynara cardunculus var. scolymus TaxID=59895 RepID=A0A103XR17_CYNCS|nr:Beta-ketoacyl synthase, active site-containing protein [Cynara cardunculus var. scolymus]